MARRGWDDGSRGGPALMAQWEANGLGAGKRCTTAGFATAENSSAAALWVFTLFMQCGEKGGGTDPFWWS